MPFRHLTEVIMSTGAIIGIVIAVIVVVAVVVVASAEMRRARLRRQFGPEYDRLVEKLGSRRKADAELAERERRVRALNIRELSPEQQASYSGDWAAVQERFVDTPAEAVGAAHVLIGNVMRDRGYPVDDRTATMDALSVHHGRSMQGYRTTSRRSATAPRTVTASPPTERAPRKPPSLSPPNPSPRHASPANPLPGSPLRRTPRSRTRTPAGPRTRRGRHAHTFSHFTGERLL